MSSSFSIDVGSYIPDSVREIFDNPEAEDWFVVYYITRDKKVIAKHTFLFKGRDQKYQAKCVSDADGLFREVFIVYRGQTARYTPSKEYSLQSVEMGKHFYMTIQGEIIP